MLSYNISMKDKKMEFIDNFIEKFVEIKLQHCKFYDEYYIIDIALALHISYDFYGLRRKILHHLNGNLIKHIRNKIKKYKFEIKYYDDCNLVSFNNVIKADLGLEVFYTHSINFCFDIVKEAIKEFLRYELNNIFDDNICKIDLNKEYCFKPVLKAFVYDYSNISQEYQNFVKNVYDNIDNIEAISKRCYIHDFSINLYFIYDLKNVIFNELKAVPEMFYYDFENIFYNVIESKLKEKINLALVVFLNLFNIECEGIITQITYKSYSSSKIIISIKILTEEEKINFKRENIKKVIFNLVNPFVKEILKETIKNYIVAIT